MLINFLKEMIQRYGYYDYSWHSRRLGRVDRRVLWEGGHLSGLLQGAAALIVFGGTIAAVIVSFPATRLRTIPAALKLAFGRSNRSSDELIDAIVDMSVTARRDGVLALERISADHEDPFLREGMQMVVDGNDPEMVRHILELDINAAEQKHEGYAKIFESAGDMLLPWGSSVPSWA